MKDHEAASEYLTKFSKLIRPIPDNSRREKVLLSTKIDALKIYFDLQFLWFNDKFEHEIMVSPELLQTDWVLKPMLILPYEENAFWHGLMHRKSKGILSVHFERNGNTLEVIMEDDGLGRAMAKCIKESKIVTRKSHGMKVAAHRMALLRKKLNIPVEAVVEDL